MYLPGHFQGGFTKEGKTYHGGDIGGTILEIRAGENKRRDRRKLCHVGIFLICFLSTCSNDVNHTLPYMMIETLKSMSQNHTFLPPIDVFLSSFPQCRQQTVLQVFFLKCFLLPF